MIRICKTCSSQFYVYPSRTKASKEGGPFFCKMECRRVFRRKTSNQELTVERLKSVLSYNRIDGLFRWIIPPNNTSGRIHPMDIAGYPSTKGYWLIKIDGADYYAHRLAWFYVYGNWPKGHLDHSDLNKMNNAIKNLRNATDSQNQANRKKTKSNTSGYKGVSFKKNAWIAQITTGKKTRHIGSFQTAKEAHEAYCNEARKDHGKFWNPG